jgi:hypothetical protein
MRLPAADLRAPFATTGLSVLPEDFVVVYLPLDTKPLLPEWHRPTTTRFGAIIRDPEELVLVVAKRKWLRMQSIFKKYEIEGPFKVIELVLDARKPVPGYLSQLGAVLSEWQIRGFPISSFRRNHILVEKPDLPRSMRALRKFIEQCKAAASDTPDKK